MKFLNGVHVQSNTKIYELLNSKDKKEQAKAKNIMKFCEEAEACMYEYQALTKLREKYKDVL